MDLSKYCLLVLPEIRIVRVQSQRRTLRLSQTRAQGKRKVGETGVIWNDECSVCVVSG